ncbi:membrane protein [Pilimelia terevasa]|uniref:Membrane protein n=1 Tax=Pilimelia terevasa TaxID=53372 RepID=A0A8J3BQ56_9ACTN|nr:DUF881 domain-containing protein [Pilimelia terevasa]GGK35060.1 membrane protein [Pilimelia terevasa]
MGDTSGTSSWRAAARRAARALRPGGGSSPRPLPGGWRRPGWSAGVPLIALAAGLLFTASATTAEGTALREDRRPRLAQLINERKVRLAGAEARAAALRGEVAAQTEKLAGTDVPVRQERARAKRLEADAAFTPVHGPGLTVQLDDAPHSTQDAPPRGATNDDLVVHQQDVQAVVNALWAGGAEAMAIMGVRVISTSAVRCAGSVLVLHGRIYSPPFTITAIGAPERLRGALADSGEVDRFRTDAQEYGLGYEERRLDDVRLPAFEQADVIQAAKVSVE